MVKFRALEALTLKPHLYARLLKKDLQHLDEDDGLIEDFTIEELIEEGALKEQNKKYLYLYQQLYQGHLSLGLVGQLSVRDYQRKCIKKHEETLDRTNQNLNEDTIVESHVGPVVVGHRNCPEIDQIIQDIRQKLKPFATWKTIDGRKHRLWRISHCSPLEDLYAKLVKDLYILDGHHRFEAAFKYLEKEGDEENDKCGWLLGIVYSTKYVQAYPQHRMLVDSDKQAMVKKIMKDQSLEISKIEDKDSKIGSGAIKLSHEGQSYLIRRPQRKNQSQKTRLPRLGVQLLNEIFEGLKKQKGSQLKIEFKPAIPGESQKEEPQSPFFQIEAPSPQQIFQLADNGILLPPKSTWLEPKPCLNMIIRLPY